MKIAHSILCTALVARSFVTLTAEANVLVYEGFHADDYTLSTATALRDANPTSENIGFESGDVWAGGTAVPKTTAGSLTLASAFSNSETNGTGRAVMVNSGSEAKGRGIYRKFSSQLPTSGTVYYRFLMKLNEDKSKYISTLQSGGYWAGGLVQNTFSGGSDSFQSLTTDGIWMGYKKTTVDGAPALTLFARIGETDYTLPFNTTSSVPLLSTWATYIFVAKIEIGTGADGKDRVSIAVQPVASTAFNIKWEWNVKNIDANIVSGGTPVSYIAFGGQYQTGNNEVAIDQFKIATTLEEVCDHVAATSPVLGDVSLSRTGAATYTVSAEVQENAADTVSWIADDGVNAPSTNGFATAVAAGSTAMGAISELTTDTTWQITALAENAGGANAKVAGTIYTGELLLGATSNAYEYGLAPGCVVVSRAAADPWPLTVNYTIAGSAGTEGTTWAAPVAVTIPANAASATLPVVPLMDGDVTEDVTITVALTAGNYEIPSVASATLTLVNLVAPAGKKTWIAAADGLASDGENWVPAGAPTASDDILFDGNFSNARCTWDAPAAVASWTQETSYTGTVDFQTTYEDGAFPVFAIAGDCAVKGGKWTHARNSDAQVWRLSVSVGGDLTVSSGVEITATGKGYASKKFPSGSSTGIHGGTVGSYTAAYGDLKHPVTIGSGGNSDGYSGGGAIHLVVTGAATIDGTLAARASTDTNGTNARYKAHGAGGSIYLVAASVAGSGSITAAGYGFNNSYQRPHGTGGRIAVVCTTAASLGFPTANMTCIGTIAGYGNSGGAGTIFVKTANQENGTLIVDNALPGANFEAWWPTKRGVTPIPKNQTWTLDAIEFRRFGVLAVPSGTTLNVPLAGISSSSDRTAGILYEGGTINFTDVAQGGPYTLTGKWTFQADEPFTFNGDVTVTGGANIGGLRFSGDYTNNFAKCDVTVNGNLTIASDGFATVEMAGPMGANASGTRPKHGGQYADLSGNQCYGSVFAPVLPGDFAQSGDHATAGIGGGALKLTVSGDLVVDGKVSANATVFSKSSASAGSVDLRARTLSGSGSITATGNQGSIQWDNGYNGVGGRIAVRVTGEDVGTTGIWTKFAARGCSTNQVVANGAVVAAGRNQNSSAGTIYLQGMSDGEKGGTIYVKNQANYDTSNVATWIPAAERGDLAADFRKSSLVVADRGVVAVGTNKLYFASVSVAEKSKIDLAGKLLRTDKAFFNGIRLPSGEYTALSAAVADYIVDSAGGGVFKVGGGGFAVIVR